MTRGAGDVPLFMIPPFSNHLSTEKLAILGFASLT